GDFRMAGAQTSEVDAVLKSFLSDYPTIIGFVVINADGIPTKWHETMPYERAVVYAALMFDFVAHCKKSLRGLLTGPAESELTNIRLRTKEGTEIICVTQVEYTLVVIQNCTGSPWVQDDEAAAPGGGGDGGS
ncbi:Dynein light chain roadblock-type 1 (Bithoraxoid-like protein) (BLP) (Dynein light chain 2A, partial [Durusdinium trenchii]